MMREEELGVEKEKSLFSVANIFLAFSIVAFVSAIAFVFTGIAGLVLTILFILVIIVGIYSIYVFFAPRNLFFTGVQEGTAIAIMVGTGARAAFVDAKMNLKGFAFDEDWNIVSAGTIRRKTESIFEKLGLGGLASVGIPGIHRIHEYLFDWSSMLQNGEIKPHKESLNYISLRQDIYATRLLEAETGQSMVPVDITLLITAKVINPYKALFRVENWLEFVINRVKVPVRDYVAGEENPRRLIIEKEELGKLFLRKLEDSGDLEYFRKEIGVEVLKVETPKIDLGELQKVATAEWEAEQKGNAEVAKQTKEGEAYKAKRVREKEADMDYLDGVYGKVQEFGDLGTTLRFLDTLSDAAKGPSNTIIPFGMIQDIARQVLGTKSSEITGLLGEGITKEDIENLKKVVKMREKD